MNGKNADFSIQQENNALSSQVIDYVHKYIMHILTENLPLPGYHHVPQRTVSMDGVIQDIFNNYFSENILNTTPAPPVAVSDINLDNNEFSYRSETSDQEEMDEEEIIEDHRTEETPFSNNEEISENSTRGDFLPTAPEYAPSATNRSQDPIGIVVSGKTIGLQPDVLTTHGNIIIRLLVPEGISEDSIGISINPGYAAIKWRHGYLEQIIPVPADIIKESAVAEIKDHILEIKIPRMTDQNTRKINIDRFQ